MQLNESISQSSNNKYIVHFVSLRAICHMSWVGKKAENQTIRKLLNFSTYKKKKEMKKITGAFAHVPKRKKTNMHSINIHP